MFEPLWSKHKSSHCMILLVTKKQKKAEFSQWCRNGKITLKSCVTWDTHSSPCIKWEIAGWVACHWYLPLGFGWEGTCAAPLPSILYWGYRRSHPNVKLKLSLRFLSLSQPPPPDKHTTWLLREGKARDSNWWIEVCGPDVLSTVAHVQTGFLVMWRSATLHIASADTNKIPLPVCAPVQLPC